MVAFRPEGPGQASESLQYKTLQHACRQHQVSPLSNAPHSGARHSNANPEDARIIDLTHAYLDADYRWERDGDWHRLQIGAPAPELESVFPAGREFGFLSAWNPASIEQPDTVNRAADAAMHAALSERGIEMRPGFSSARNRSWREPSWVTIDLPRDELDVLSRRFRQLATLYWRRGEPIRLRMDHARPPALDGTRLDRAGLPEDTPTRAVIANLDCVDWLPTR